MSLETRINGRLIGVANVRNTLISDEPGYDLYEIKYLRMDGDPPIVEFNVLHKREDGAEALALLVYQEIDRELKNSK